MGLGKTVQTIAFLGYLHHYVRVRKPHLIIVPKSTLNNWTVELQKWCPSLSVISFHGTSSRPILLTHFIGSKEERQDMIKSRFRSPISFHVCLASYETIMSEQHALRRIKWAYVVIDEAQRIKNEDTMLARLVRVFKSSNRLLLTGMIWICALQSVLGWYSRF